MLQFSSCLWPCLHPGSVLQAFGDLDATPGGVQWRGMWGTFGEKSFKLLVAGFGI